MQTILVVFHLFLAVSLIGLILIQHGKGADMGAAFGSGASGTVFGAKGSASFLTRMTAGLATLFFLTSMVMAYFATQRGDGNVVLDVQQPPAVESVEQPQTDLPPLPAGSDETAVPAAAGEAPAVPAATGDEPAVPAAESSAETVSGSAVEAAQEAAVAPDAAPAEPAQPSQSKE